MKWVVDIELEVTLEKELLVDAVNAKEAREKAREWAQYASGSVGSGDDEWDEQGEGGPFTLYPALKLLDRRTAGRMSDAHVLSDTHCDNCDATKVRTLAYGDARVCGACLKILPPLV